MVTKKTTKKIIKKTTKKKIAKRKAGKRTAKRKLPGWIILLGGMLIGLMIALFGYINGWVPKPDNPNDKPIAQIEQTNTNQDETVDLALEPPIQQRNDFDFYDNLPDMEVVIDKAEIEQTQNRKAKISYIQLGSFRNIADAERLKAQVAFTGKTAKIETVEVNQSIWHRVKIGPYTSSRKADKDKRALQKNNFKPIITNK